MDIVLIGSLLRDNEIIEGICSIVLYPFKPSVLKLAGKTTLLNFSVFLREHNYVTAECHLPLTKRY